MESYLKRVTFLEYCKRFKMLMSQFFVLFHVISRFHNSDLPKYMYLKQVTLKKCLNKIKCGIISPSIFDDVKLILTKYYINGYERKMNQYLSKAKNVMYKSRKVYCNVFM